MKPLFVAMKGTNHDSHAFIGEMVRRDVKAFLAERKTQLPAGCGCVVVPSAIAALQQLAAHHRTRFKGRVVGITGSNGKTVVKEWIAQQIPAGVKYFRSPKSYNSQLGVALSLLMIEGDEELALIEAGISCPGEMVRLERMIRPDTVIFTSIDISPFCEGMFSTIPSILFFRSIFHKSAIDDRTIISQSKFKILFTCCGIRLKPKKRK